ncbi:phytanoyl-CoA dioxygenase, peroxisomal [Lingula anatina]|uniref:Phytanoyl-CoA dioxygenase, peroxisomal n=1 Tax=Lingula anatina TaxID=7574 RepID=A0A1S3JNX8_LINAN|nr:phytanoyl-CoA dioxygenase, peroxisomal [Lingula anatina]|eukprot:XP_013411699.1 phytanoyl-CoA dioxygenase, peroxisomal [Lingula anatina]
MSASMSQQPREFSPGILDWSTVHKPTGELFPPVKDKNEWNKFKWSQDQVDQFRRDGFLLHVPLLTEEQCDKILEDFKYFMDPRARHPGHAMLYEFHANQCNDPNNVVMHVLGHWRLTKALHDLVFLPQVVVPASQLVDESCPEAAVRLWTDQLFLKPPRHGGVVAWHQDYSYWVRTKPMKHITVHIALDDQTEENGCIQYVPGSHRWTRNGDPFPVLDHSFRDMEGIKSILTDEEKAAFKPVPALLKKGHASFHNAMTVHGSYDNKTDKPRRAAVLNYFADGVYSDTDKAMLRGNSGTDTDENLDDKLSQETIIPKGHKMEGQFFPLVYDPAWTK